MKLSLNISKTSVLSYSVVIADEDEIWKKGHLLTSEMKMQIHTQAYGLSGSNIYSNENQKTPSSKFLRHTEFYSKCHY